MAHPRFKISNGPDEQFGFNLTAANGEKILSSERYSSHAAAEKGVASVKVNAAIDARFDRRTAKNGQWYFVLKAGNGEVVGTSETYSSKTAMEHGIAAVQENAPIAPVE